MIVAEVKPSLLYARISSLILIFSGETEPLAAGSPDSFDADTEKVVGGSETDSMAEYGDVDPSKFNEDGSFIGQYGDAKPTSEPNAPSAMSTFV